MLPGRGGLRWPAGPMRASRAPGRSGRDHSSLSPFLVSPALANTSEVGAFGRATLAVFMPEGDVVWRTADRLQRALAGRDLSETDFRWPSIAEVSLVGWSMAEVLPRGKHLLMRCVPPVGADSPLMTIHSHLKMEGTWTVRRTGPIRDSRIRQLRARIGNAEWTASGYLLGRLTVLPTAAESEVVGHLGPDILGPDWDASRVLATLATAPDRAIGEALLDQRVLAGIGTFFMAEVLFCAGVSPWTPTGQVQNLAQILARAQSMLRFSCQFSRQTTTGNTRAGQRNWVHGRSRRPCLRCGTPISVDPIGVAPQDRVAFHCPGCQPRPQS